MIHGVFHREDGDYQLQKLDGFLRSVPIQCNHDWRALNRSKEAWRERRCKNCKMYAWQLEGWMPATDIDFRPLIRELGKR